MTALIRLVGMLASAAALAGCASTAPVAPSAVVTSSQARVIPADRVHDAVAIGRSTLADVRAALGDTLTIRFDNGFEVWVYRLANGTRVQGVARATRDEAARATTPEYVILFAPSGLVTKTRIRPAPQDVAAR